ncbi:MAG TPA: hypothetical protein VK983_04930 [Candidatus Limnocylindrales bacterium]|nr:hypothetical protein [Candidatus Limnocylindrales bacterium]
MDIDLLILTAIFALIYGYYLYFFTWYDVRSDFIRIYRGYSGRRFSAFYNMVEDGYSAYAYFFDPILSNVQFLQAFDRYDVETAYAEYRHRISQGIRNCIRLFIKHSLILLIVGYFIFPEPLLGYVIVLGYYIVRLSYQFINQRRLSAALIMSSHELIHATCSYAYGSEEAIKLLRPRQGGDIEKMRLDRDKTLNDYIVDWNERLWGEKRWVNTLIVWIVGLVPLSIMATYTTNNILVEIEGVFILFYILFPFSFVIYKFQTMDLKETDAEQAPTSAPSGDCS